MSLTPTPCGTLKFSHICISFFVIVSLQHRCCKRPSQALTTVSHIHMKWTTFSHPSSGLSQALWYTTTALTWAGYVLCCDRVRWMQSMANVMMLLAFVIALTTMYVLTLLMALLASYVLALLVPLPAPYVVVVLLALLAPYVLTLVIHLSNFNVLAALIHLHVLCVHFADSAMYMQFLVSCRLRAQQRESLRALDLTPKAPYDIMPILCLARIVMCPFEVLRNRQSSVGAIPASRPPLQYSRMLQLTGHPSSRDRLPSSTVQGGIHQAGLCPVA